MKGKIEVQDILIDVINSGVSVWISSRDTMNEQVTTNPVLKGQSLLGEGIIGRTMHDTSSSNFPVIWINSALSKPQQISTLAHEAVHAANMICQKKGIETSQDNDEMIAYIVEYIMKKAKNITQHK